MFKSTQLESPPKLIEVFKNWPNRRGDEKN